MKQVKPIKRFVRDGEIHDCICEDGIDESKFGNKPTLKEIEREVLGSIASEYMYRPAIVKADAELLSIIAQEPENLSAKILYSETRRMLGDDLRYRELRKEVGSGLGLFIRDFEAWKIGKEVEYHMETDCDNKGNLALRQMFIRNCSCRLTYVMLMISWIAILVCMIMFAPSDISV